jgi:glycosyltransferase involved in cell wall biosynthesis
VGPELRLPRYFDRRRRCRPTKQRLPLTNVKCQMKTIADWSSDDLAADCQLIEISGFFDAVAYRRAAGLDETANAAEHYLLEGWRHGFDHGTQFDGRFLAPYYESVGWSGPPLSSFLKLQAAGHSFATFAQAEDLASRIRGSELFDSHEYASRAGIPVGLDPALHYVIVGEVTGIPPSDGFDPEYYKRRYPDVALHAPMAFFHFLAHGRPQGRAPVSMASRIHFDLSRFLPDREAVVVLTHDASRTGAPILALNIVKRLQKKYNVVVVLLGGGALAGDFRDCCSATIGPLNNSGWHPVEAEYIIDKLFKLCDFAYSIINSIESRDFVRAIARHFVPVISLIHEFASYTRPKKSMVEAFDWSTELVFSCDLTADSAKIVHPTLANQSVHILPQGRCDLPPMRGAATGEAEKLKDIARQKSEDNALIVLGAGTVHIRKGVDLFIATAAAVNRANLRRKVHFVWAGQGYDPENDMTYSCYLMEQIKRSDLEDKLTMLGEVADLEALYALADMFFLSSRLDPLPNVTIDAALHELSIVCFEGASGMAELLAADGSTKHCVVPHLDTQMAADLIASLANDGALRAQTGIMTRRLAERVFDMDRYVGELDSLGQRGRIPGRQHALDFTTIKNSPLFDRDVFLPPERFPVARDEAIKAYLAYWNAVGLSRNTAGNANFRRPCAGFHPQIYAHLNQVAENVNPFADYIRKGHPEGPWQHDVIFPSPGSQRAPSALHVVLHGHFFYPELIDDFLERLARNSLRCDLILTTDTVEKAGILRQAAFSYKRGSLTIRCDLPNRGRNIGPFLHLLEEGAFKDYDLVGHIHGKRSLAAGETMGDMWRDFLWQNLVGELFPMVDRIAEAFEQDSQLGLVFPDDPNLVGWDGNQDLATTLARKMGISADLPPFSDFPVGAMFWSRTDALMPLLKLKLGWNQYPAEPVPYDGTILHALERLLPFVAMHSGYRFATTCIPGLSR